MVETCCYSSVGNLTTRTGPRTSCICFGRCRPGRKILSRARYREFCKKLAWADEDAKMAFADAFWNKFKFIGDGKSDSDYLDPTGIEAESQTLKAGIDKVLLYANRNLAHRTADGTRRQ